MDSYQSFMCPMHGLRHIQYKCDFCCNAATFRCRANTFYCDECHVDSTRLSKRNCGGNATKCPWNITHEVGRKGVPIASCIICKSKAEVGNLFLDADINAAKLKKTLLKVDLDLKNILSTKKREKYARDSVRSMNESIDSMRAGSSMSSSRSNSGRRVFWSQELFSKNVQICAKLLIWTACE